MEKMKENCGGRFGTGMCDGWKNVAKTSIVGSMVNVEYEPHILNIYEVKSERKSAINLLAMVEQEIDFCLMELAIFLVAYCSDNGGESRGMCSLLAKKWPWIVIVACWAHQVNLILGDYFKGNPALKATVSEALEVVKWFNNHGRALGILQEYEVTYIGKALCLILPVITRWTSYYLSVRRLLELENMIICAVCDREAELVASVGSKKALQDKAKKIMATLCFLSSVLSFLTHRMHTRIRQHLEPLAVAANIIQGDNARLDVVLVAILSLYSEFSQAGDRGAPILKSISKRWSDTDQEVFLLALILNPYIRQTAFKAGSTFASNSTCWMLFRRVYKRMLQRDPPKGTRKVFIDYLCQAGWFSDTAMDLSGWEEEAETAPINLLSIWHDLDNKTDPFVDPVNAVVTIALRTLSIVPNSAAIERLFSGIGSIHSKLRNRLDAERVRKIVLVK
ncbi:ribonuclease H-like domain-containing protein, partial [Amylostereum chailletii]